MIRTVFAIALLLAVLVSCRKPDPENPYEGLVSTPETTVDVDDLPVGNFAWLHGKVFLPTCANSGCHDGTFEPEFLTISSSYNSLVNHAVIANDAAFSFEHRVVPGDVSASFLHERMTVEIPNTSGMMPLTTEPESDWEELRDFYIQQVEAWIDGGAPDMWGTLPPDGNDFPPQVDGFLAFPTGTTAVPFERDPDEADITPYQVTAGVLDLWFAVSDDQATVEELTGSHLKMSDVFHDFSDVSAETPLTLQNGFSGSGLTGGTVQFRYKATVDLSGFPSDSTVWLRTYWNEPTSLGFAEVPGTGANLNTATLFAIEVQ